METETVAEYIAEGFSAVERFTAVSCGGEYLRDAARDYFVSLPGGAVARIYARRKPCGRWRVESMETLAAVETVSGFAGDDFEQVAAAIDAADSLAAERRATA